jgi:hypothetical protein
MNSLCNAEDLLDISLCGSPGSSTLWPIASRAVKLRGGTPTLIHVRLFRMTAGQLFLSKFDIED